MRLIDAARHLARHPASLFDYKETEYSLGLSFWEVICLICMGIFYFYAFFAPWLINLPFSTGIIDPTLISEPLSGYKHILGTDVYGRDLLDMLFLGLNKTFLIAVVCVLFHAVVTLPLAFYTGLMCRKNSFVNKLLEPLNLFPAIFLFLCLSAIVDASLLVIYIAVLLSTFIFVFFNTYRDVAQILELPLIRVMEMDGAHTHHILRLVLIPTLIPNILRLLRRTLVLTVSELIAIGALQFNLNPLGAYWGTIIRQAWRYASYNPYPLFLTFVFISFTLYCNSISFIVGEKFLHMRNLRIRRAHKQRRIEQFRKWHEAHQYEE